MRAQNDAAVTVFRPARQHFLVALRHQHREQQGRGEAKCGVPARKRGVCEQAGAGIAADTANDGGVRRCGAEVIHAAERRNAGRAHLHGARVAGQIRIGNRCIGLVIDVEDAAGRQRNADNRRVGSRGFSKRQVGIAHENRAVRRAIGEEILRFSRVILRNRVDLPEQGLQIGGKGRCGAVGGLTVVGFPDRIQVGAETVREHDAVVGRDRVVDQGLGALGRRGIIVDRNRVREILCDGGRAQQRAERVEQVDGVGIKRRRDRLRLRVSGLYGQRGGDNCEYRCRSCDTHTNPQANCR